MAEKNTANIGFEKQIWDAACVLRGNMDASEYKNVVLGLIFLKYISDRFEEKHQALMDEGDGFEEDRDEYTSEGIFFVPAGARWSEIAAKAHTPEIGTVIDDAMRAIEKENKRLKDILPKNFARPELDKRRLGDVVDLFTNIQMIEHGSEKDILGRTYEYCLSMFAEQEGKRGGEFFTPSCVVRTLVEVLQPFQGRVYEKTLSTLIQTNDTYESTQIDAFFESKPKIDAFLKIDANAQKVGIQNGILTPDVLETGCRFYVCGIFLVCFLYCVLRTSEKRAVSSFPLSCMPRLIHSSIHP